MIHGQAGREEPHEFNLAGGAAASKGQVRSRVKTREDYRGFSGLKHLAHSLRVMLEFNDYAAGFSGASVVTSPPANTGGTGSIPGPGRPHVHTEQLKPVRPNY